MTEKTESRKTVSVRVLRVDASWLMDHRNSKQKGVADVIHKLIEESNHQDSL